jgi:hypothetical protein
MRRIVILSCPLVALALCSFGCHRANNETVTESDPGGEVPSVFQQDVPATEKEQAKAGNADDNEDAKLERWFVYRDADSEGNHGHWTNFMAKDNKELIEPFRLADKVEPAFGETCIKATVKFQAASDWCGVAVSCAPDYWGEQPSDAAFDLKKATKLVFYARGENGGESIQVKVAVAGDKKFGDSAKIPAATSWLTLKKTWQPYELPINAKRTNLERVVTPFCFVTDKAHNRADEITVYFDHVYFVMEGK